MLLLRFKHYKLLKQPAGTRFHRHGLVKQFPHGSISREGFLRLVVLPLLPLLPSVHTVAPSLRWTPVPGVVRLSPGLNCAGPCGGSSVTIPTPSVHTGRGLPPRSIRALRRLRGRVGGRRARSRSRPSLSLVSAFAGSCQGAEDGVAKVSNFGSRGGQGAVTKASMNALQFKQLINASGEDKVWTCPLCRQLRITGQDLVKVSSFHGDAVITWFINTLA